MYQKHLPPIEKFFHSMFSKLFTMLGSRAAKGTTLGALKVAVLANPIQAIMGTVVSVIVFTGLATSVILVGSSQDIRQQALMEGGTGGNEQCNTNCNTWDADTCEGGVNYTCLHYSNSCTNGFNGTKIIGGTACESATDASFDPKDVDGNGIPDVFKTCYNSFSACSGINTNVNGGKCSDLNGLYNSLIECQTAVAPTLTCFNVNSGCGAVNIKKYPDTVTCVNKGYHANQSSCLIALDSLTGGSDGVKGALDSCSIGLCQDVDGCACPSDCAKTTVASGEACGGFKLEDGTITAIDPGTGGTEACWVLLQDQCKLGTASECDNSPSYSSETECRKARSDLEFYTDTQKTVATFEWYVNDQKTACNSVDTSKYQSDPGFSLYSTEYECLKQLDTCWKISGGVVNNIWDVSCSEVNISECNYTETANISNQKIKRYYATNAACNQVATSTSNIINSSCVTANGVIKSNAETWISGCGLDDSAKGVFCADSQMLTYRCDGGKTEAFCGAHGSQGCKVCDPGEIKCNGLNEFQRCRADSSGFGRTDRCGNGLTCSAANNGCVDYICSEGSEKKDGQCSCFNYQTLKEKLFEPQYPLPEECKKPESIAQIPSYLLDEIDQDFVCPKIVPGSGCSGKSVGDRTFEDNGVCVADSTRKSCYIVLDSATQADNKKIASSPVSENSKSLNIQLDPGLSEMDSSDSQGIAKDVGTAERSGTEDTHQALCKDRFVSQSECELSLNNSTFYECQKVELKRVSCWEKKYVWFGSNIINKVGSMVDNIVKNVFKPFESSADSEPVGVIEKIVLFFRQDNVGRFCPVAAMNEYICADLDAFDDDPDCVNDEKFNTIEECDNRVAELNEFRFCVIQAESGYQCSQIINGDTGSCVDNEIFLSNQEFSCGLHAQVVKEQANKNDVWCLAQNATMTYYCTFLMSGEDKSFCEKTYNQDQTTETCESEAARLNEEMSLSTFKEVVNSDSTVGDIYLPQYIQFNFDDSLGLNLANQAMIDVGNLSDNSKLESCENRGFCAIDFSVGGHVYISVEVLKNVATCQGEDKVCRFRENGCVVGESEIVDRDNFNALDAANQFNHNCK